MCGRYVLRSSTPELARLLGIERLPETAPRYNVAPSQPVPVCRATEDGAREVVAMRWGLVPRWTKDPKQGYRMINARAETLSERPAFRAAFARRRCLVPADGFYEWQQRGARKQPHFIRMRNEAAFCFAGLWEEWDGGDAGQHLTSCTIITTEANAFLAPIHPRMPVILGAEDHGRWLDPTVTETASVRPLLIPFASDTLTAFPVSTFVNSPRNDDSRCIAPLAA